MPENPGKRPVFTRAASSKRRRMKSKLVKLACIEFSAVFGGENTCPSAGELVLARLPVRARGRPRADSLLVHYSVITPPVLAHYSFESQFRLS